MPLQSGKSTYLRMVGVVTVLAHIGCFVPATFASIRLTDHILTRHTHTHAHLRTHARRKRVGRQSVSLAASDFPCNLAADLTLFPVADFCRALWSVRVSQA